MTELTLASSPPSAEDAMLGMRPAAIIYYFRSSAIFFFSISTGVSQSPDAFIAAILSNFCCFFARLSFFSASILAFSSSSSLRIRSSSSR
jgi:hypothetical protein